MARTFIRQDDQIASSNTSGGGFADTVAPSLANYQTSPNTILDDLNNLRSVVHYLKNIQTSNWYAAQTAPVTLETGILRGVDNLNNALHLVEKKRVLRDVYTLVDISVPASAFATGTLTLTGNVSNGDQITTGTKTYTFQTVLTNVDGNVLIGATASDSLDNLIAAITLGAGSGTLYAAATTANTFVTAAAGVGDTMVATALTAGTAGNTIATTDPVDGGGVISWGAATLTGGAGDVSILTAPQLPSNTTAAVGIVTTLGTVVAAHPGTFGVVSLAEVAGSNAIAAKNLCYIVNGATRDPIFSSGRIIYGLLQSENATDGHTMTGTTPDRVQLSFVRLNAAGDDLELCPAADIGGQSINYAYRERMRLEGLNEADFLRGAAVDLPGASTEDRQDVYDNQGITPVELTTNATLDLNSAGIYWELRDLVNATLFRLTEGSGGGTTTLQIGTDVDTFDVNAVVNDFNSGIQVRTGGTRPISIGVSDGVVETTAGDLRLFGFGEMYLDDGNQTGSTWAQTNGIKLSDTTTEWDNFETAFGEVSLLNAIYQAANSNIHLKIYAVLTANVLANNDVSGPSDDNNLDVDLGDLSQGSFINDYDVYLNGVLLRAGANSGSNHDYYPGTSLANGQLRFEFNLIGTGSKPDQLTVIKYVS